MEHKFKTKVTEINESFMRFEKLETLQVNLGNICNQACSHCHISAGPSGTHVMTRETMDHITTFLKNNNGLILDVTGGAPEMNPGFRYFIESALPYTSRVMVRTNLTIMTEEGYRWLPDWYSKNGIVLISSLPCYLEENVDRQRGAGVYNKSIQALKMLNERGYGRSLELNIVYNPGDAFLPPDQNLLEDDYKKQLYERFGILFNYLFTITNAPIGRFEEYLKKTNQHSSYMSLLRESFNPNTLGNIMCRTLINIDWEGVLYNCDFNKVKNMPVRDGNGDPLTIREISRAIEKGHPIEMAEHCYVCTAGSGASCTGALDAG